MRKSSIFYMYLPDDKSVSIVLHLTQTFKPWDQVELSFTAFKYQRSPSNFKCKQLNGLMKCFKHTVY